MHLIGVLVCGLWLIGTITMSKETTRYTFAEGLYYMIPQYPSYTFHPICFLLQLI